MHELLIKADDIDHKQCAVSPVAEHDCAAVVMQLDQLEDGTKYTITVCAQCSIGDGETSTIEASTVLAIAPSGLVTPSLLTATWETLTVEWQPPAHTNGAPVTGAAQTAH